MKKVLFILIAVMAWGMSGYGQIDASTYNRVNAQLQGARSGSSSSSRSTGSSGSFGQGLLNTGFNSFFNSLEKNLSREAIEARQARQLEAQQRYENLMYQLQLQREEDERLRQEEIRIKQEEFEADVASTLAGLKGVNNDDGAASNVSASTFKSMEDDYETLADFTANNLGIKINATLAGEEATDGTVAYIGKSHTPINKNPLELKVNAQIQDNTNIPAPEMVSTIEADRQKREEEKQKREEEKQVFIKSLIESGVNTQGVNIDEYEPDKYYCGSREVYDETERNIVERNIVPQTANFSCFIHDRQYAIHGFPKEEADEIFKNNIFIELKKMHGFNDSQARNAAKIYYDGVKINFPLIPDAHDAYNKAQNKVESNK